MTYETRTSAIYETKATWVSKPLNRTGDLSGWRKKMNQTCPNPRLGEIVWLNSSYGRISYKAVGFRSDGSAIWERGELVRH